MKLTLIELTAVLGCSRATASLVRAGKYPAKNGQVAGQYAALLALIESVSIGTEAERCESLCLACPRDNCDGCRVAEIITK
ncbi:hypothetical protein [Rhodoferax sp.]|uniref:hypothetical protein n=1 Tax=Rhodoferax sp. TaxID=50421 RepID=UPI00261C803E|nr:hypothetical protein [Rhodoferax sp.]MDD3938020.1 hypothetical protein [Rhodoferax sp.]